MTAKEILKKKNYIESVNALTFKPDSLDPDTRSKLCFIQDMFKNSNLLLCQNNAVLILKMYLVDNMTIDQISVELKISSRHVDRLKKQAIDIISKLLDL